MVVFMDVVFVPKLKVLVGDSGPFHYADRFRTCFAKLSFLLFVLFVSLLPMMRLIGCYVRG